MLDEMEMQEGGTHYLPASSTSMQNAYVIASSLTSRMFYSYKMPFVSHMNFFVLLSVKTPYHRKAAEANAQVFTISTHTKHSWDYLRKKLS